MHVNTCTASDVTTAIFDKSNVYSANYLCKLNVISVVLTLSKSTHNCIACTLNQRNARPAPTWFPQVLDNPNNINSANKCSYRKLNNSFNPYNVIIAMNPVNPLICISLVHLAEASMQREFFRVCMCNVIHSHAQTHSYIHRLKE
jgi:hypothetical protein